MGRANLAVHPNKNINKSLASERDPMSIFPIISSLCLYFLNEIETTFFGDKSGIKFLLSSHGRLTKECRQC